MRKTDNFTTFMCRLSRYLGASRSRNPQDQKQTCTGIVLSFTCLMTYCVCVLNVITVRNESCTPIGGNS